MRVVQGMYALLNKGAEIRGKLGEAATSLQRKVQGLPYRSFAVPARVSGEAEVIGILDNLGGTSPDVTTTPSDLKRARGAYEGNEIAAFHGFQRYHEQKPSILDASGTGMWEGVALIFNPGKNRFAITGFGVTKDGKVPVVTWYRGHSPRTIGSGQESLLTYWADEIRKDPTQGRFYTFGSSEYPADENRFANSFVRMEDPQTKAFVTKAIESLGLTDFEPDSGGLTGTVQYSEE